MIPFVVVVVVVIIFIIIQTVVVMALFASTPRALYEGKKIRNKIDDFKLFFF